MAISAPWMDNDTEPDDMFTLWLSNEALATSGIDYRNWQHDGQIVHHLIDPPPGRQRLTDGLTVTILADDAAQAEAWATATLVAGSEPGMDALLDADLAGLMVTQSGDVLVTTLMDQHFRFCQSGRRLSEQLYGTVKGANKVCLRILGLRFTHSFSVLPRNIGLIDDLPDPNCCSDQ